MGISQIERQRRLLTLHSVALHMVYYLSENVSQLKTLSITLIPIECRDL